MISLKEEISKFIKPVFEELNLLDYLKVSFSDKADFQINSVFQIAKERHVNPSQIGEEIVSKINSLDNFNDYFESVQFVNPGFINIFLSNVFINKCLNDFKNGNFNKATIFARFKIIKKLPFVYP